MTEQLVNTVAGCVDDNIRGVLLQNPGIRALKGHPRIVVREDIQEYKATGRLSLLVGGGSGHEPFALGYVGPGMATCCVMGSLFASPGPRLILEGLRAAGRGSKGVIVITYNYTGDRLNFGLAIERARAEGINVRMLVHSDDCARIPGATRGAGRRGVAGGVLLIKMYGAMVEAGYSMDDIERAHDVIKKELVTLGVCLKPCRLPGVGPLFSLTEGRIELGMGLHGEPGAENIEMQSAHDLIQTMLSRIRSEESPHHLKSHPGQHVAILLGNYGSMCDMEMNILLMESITQIEELGLRVTRAYSGRLMTSMDMTGFSLSILLLDDTRAQMLDAPTGAFAWPRQLLPQGVRDRFNNTPMEDINVESGDDTQQEGAVVSDNVGQSIQSALRLLCARIGAAEDRLNKLDGEGRGDGDCGSTLAAGARAVLADLDSGTVSISRPQAMMLHLAHTLEGVMGGCSGALYSLLLTGAASALADEVGPSAWVQALWNGIELIARYGGTKPGDRTMVDPLRAAASSLKETMGDGNELTKDNLELAVKAAEASAEATATMEPGAGRACYIRADLLNEPDAGAAAIAIMARAIIEGLWPQ